MQPEGYDQIADAVRAVRHDAGDPLTAALGNVRLLLEDPRIPPDEAEEMLRAVHGELRRLAGVVRRLDRFAAGAAMPGKR